MNGYSCPLSYKQIELSEARINSFFVALLLVGYFFCENVVLLLFLLFDLFIRLYLKPSYSLLASASKKLKKLFSFQDSFADGGAKRVANHFGLFFAGLLLAGHLYEWHLFSLLIGLLFFVCTLLDSFFGWCLGCKIYYLYKKATHFFHKYS